MTSIFWAIYFQRRKEKAVACLSCPTLRTECVIISTALSAGILGELGPEYFFKELILTSILIVFS